MQIIVEGVDGIGKSTLVEGLAKALNYTIIHNKANTDNSFKYYYALLRVPSIIQDRSFISEMVYCEVLQRPVVLSDEALAILFTPDVDTENNKVIILHSSDERIYYKNNLDEAQFLKDKQAEINNEYYIIGKEFEMIMFDVAKYQGKPELLLEDVLEAIK